MDKTGNKRLIDPNNQDDVEEFPNYQHALNESNQPISEIMSPLKCTHDEDVEMLIHKDE